MASRSAAAKQERDERDEAAPGAPRRVKLRAFLGGEVTEMPADAVEVRDEAGRLLVRFEDGAAVIAAPAGDLTLEAPAGRVVVRSATDVVLEAARDVTHHAGREVSLSAGAAGADPQVSVRPQATSVKTPRLDVAAAKSRVVTGEATVVARRIVTTAEHVAESVGRLEIRARRLVERTGDTFREAAGLAQVRAGRMRTLVAEVHAMYARRTVVVSKEDTSVDGRRVLLG